jgi:hypothetical protein
MNPCPYCGSSNHEPLSDPSLSADRRYVLAVVRCNNCLNCWKETYELKPLSWQPAQEESNP